MKAKSPVLDLEFPVYGSFHNGGRSFSLKMWQGQINQGHAVNHRDHFPFIAMVNNAE